MIVNLYVDHMLSTPPASAEEVWNATSEHARLFSTAAERIGLSPAEYSEFRANLLDGKAAYVRLPRRLDAMSGNRRGSVYVVHNAVMTAPAMGWRVALADGNVVYVPQTCGNLSLLRPTPVAHAAKVRPLAAAHARPRYNQAMAVVPHDTPVSVATPDVVAVAPVAPIVAAAPAAAAAPVAAAHGGGLFYFVPAVIGAVVGLTHGGGSSSPAPACSQGSNTTGVCSK